MFLIVCGKMLDTRADVSALQAAHLRRCHLTGKKRVLRLILEVSSAERRTFDVHGGSEVHSQLLMLAGVADRLADFFHHVRIKGAGRRTRCREADRLDTVVDSEMVCALILLAKAVRAVADHNLRNAETLHRLGVPEIAAGEKSRLLFQRHLADQFLNIHDIPSNNLIPRIGAVVHFYYIRKTSRPQ